MVKVLSSALIVLLTGWSTVFAQKIPAIIQKEHSKTQEASSLGFQQGSHECISKAQRANMIAGVQENLRTLEAEGKFNHLNANFKSVSGLEWPLRVANSYDACNYYSIFQYFDHDPVNPGSVEDWNCGDITYDVPGYNHNGTDIGIFPFARTMQENDAVEVIAAAPGIIVQKVDGNYDQNCNGSNPNWNYLFVQHSDGTFALYGHMKDQSLTSLQVGDSINTGDYIGIVGSSGASTGPHLHFEIMEANLTSVDPYTGPCNSGTSMWANQNTYLDKGINRVMTHSAAPSNNTCPTLETINEQTVFELGPTVYLGSYLRHADASDVFTVTVKKPDGSVYWTTTHSPNQFFAAYQFYFFITVSTFQPEGTWTYELSTNYGDSCSTEFVIQDCPLDLSVTTTIPIGSNAIHEEAANSINSTSLIYPNNDVKYDAANMIDLMPGFEAKVGSDFEAFLDGCGGM